MAHPDESGRGTEAALAALGAKPDEIALDAWTDPAGAAAALGKLDDARRHAILRAASDGPIAIGEGAKEPPAPGWLRLTRGSPEIAVCADGGAATCETRRATRVVAESAPLPGGAEGAVARVSIALDRKGGGASKLIVAEVWARTEELAVARVRGVASKLSRALSVPASLPGAAESKDEDAAEGDAPGLSARALSRFTLRGEGPMLVLRDFASAAPREGAGLHIVIGLAFVGLAAGAWMMFAKSAQAAGATASGSLGWLGGSVLLTLAATAFLGVARFTLKYAAASAPLVAIGSGKVTVAPWVSRSGAVMPEPEGRFGAGIDLGEVRGVSVQSRKGQLALEVATDHGPIDALLMDDPTLAQHLAAALGRAIDDLRPAAAGPTARQRARQRAGAA